MATTVETFHGSRISFVDGVFIAESSLAHQYVKGLGNGHRVVDLDDFELSIVHTGQLLEELDHPLSQSNYFGRIEGKANPNKVLFYKMGANKESSAHSHQVRPHKMPELYFGIGKSYLYTEDAGWHILNGTVEKPALAWVNPGVRHFVMTLDEPAFNAVVMVNALHYPEDMQHIMIPDQVEFKREARKLLTLA